MSPLECSRWTSAFRVQLEIFSKCWNWDELELERDFRLGFEGRIATEFQGASSVECKPSTLLYCKESQGRT